MLQRDSVAISLLTAYYSCEQAYAADKSFLTVESAQYLEEQLRTGLSRGLKVSPTPRSAHELVICICQSIAAAASGWYSSATTDGRGKLADDAQG